MSVHKKFGFLKTTAIGGIIFLFPLIIIGALIGQLVPIVMSIAEVIGKVLWMPWMKTPWGIAVLILLAIAVLILLCFVAGILARRSFGKKISQTFEKNLLMLFPRYAIFKDQLTGSVGGDVEKPRMKAALVTFEEWSRIGFEVDRSNKGLVSVYFPGAPDPWTGTVMLVDQDRVKLLDADFGETVATFEKLGKDSSWLLDARVMDQSDDAAK